MHGAATVTQLMHAFGEARRTLPRATRAMRRLPRNRRSSIACRSMLAGRRRPTRLEARPAAFLRALGQRTAPIGSGRILSYYAAGVATDVVGAAWPRGRTRVALVHPIIDCIPASSGTAARARPGSRGAAAGPDPLAGLEPTRVNIANPNNPTGALLAAGRSGGSPTPVPSPRRRARDRLLLPGRSTHAPSTTATRFSTRAAPSTSSSRTPASSGPPAASSSGSCHLRAQSTLAMPRSPPTCC